jgi:GT2 family glycosyltransferase
VTIVRTKPRIGYAKANFIGATIALRRDVDYIVTVNQDAVVASDCVSELISALEDSPQAVIAAPLVYDRGLSSIESFFVRWYLTQCSQLLFDALSGEVRQVYEMRYVSGACLCVRASFVAAFGFFDPVYFMYLEDEDLCRRARYLGYKVLLAPRARVAHCHSHADEAPQFRQTRSQWHRRSAAIYMLKDIRTPFRNSLVRVEFQRLCEYIRLLGALRLRAVRDHIASDLILHLSLPRIFRSRRIEAELVRSHTAALFPRDALNRERF